MTRRTPENRCAPVGAWPQVDQARWKIALSDPDPFEPIVGYARRWAPKTVILVEKGYGRWINWLHLTGQLDADSVPEERPTDTRLRSYFRGLQDAGIGDYTIANYLQQLGNALVAMAPTGDWSGILRAAGRVRLDATPVKDVDSRMQPPEVLLELGWELMTSAEHQQGLSTEERATQFRDGLMVILLVHRPLRVANVAQIRIGEHLHQRNGAWWLAFSPDEMKTSRPFEFSLPTSFAEPMRRYLETVRPLLLARRTLGDTSALFVTREGSAMTEGRISERITIRTAKAFDKSVNPHLFRHIAATTIATANPENVTDVARVLGHASMRTSEKHYIRARTVEAGRNYQSTVTAIRRGEPTRRRGGVDKN